MEKLPAYYDISPVVSEHIAVYPGDIPYSREILFDMQRRGDHLTLSGMRTTFHVGAHTDAPNHYGKTGCDMAQRALDYYIGACQVVTVGTGRGKRVQPEHLTHAGIAAPRVLLRTDSYPDPNVYNKDFCSLTPQLIDYLADKQVALVGIDTPSIDPWDSKNLETHRRVFARDMAILEGIVLTGVPDGHYHLLAIPLRIRDADASPVRALLFKQPLFK